MKKWFVVSVTAVVALMGCSDPKKASEKNFQKVLQAYYDEQEHKGVCISLRGTYVSPGEEQKNAILRTADIIASKKRDEERELWDTWESLGMLKLIGKVDDTPKYNANPSMDYHLYAYMFTDEAKKYIVQNKKGSAMLCTGHTKVTEILQYTEPSDAWGATVSEVKYKIVNEDVADWAKNQVIQKNYTDINDHDYFASSKIVLEAERKEVLVLMNDGWKVDGK